MALSFKSCGHLEKISEVKTVKTYACKECVKINATWVHLRTCQDCGATLCCDSSPNKHARKHAKEHEHPIISSAEPGEKWLFCYKDGTIKKY